MAVSDYVLERLYQDNKDKINGSRIDKILKVGDKNVAFILFHNGKTKTLLLSLNPTLPLFLCGDGLISFVEESNGFFAILKKYFEYGQIIAFEKVKSDRVIKIKVRKRLPTYVYMTSTLVFEMIPMRANLIILDENNKIIDAYHKSEGFEGKHVLIKGLTYEQEDTYDKEIYEDDTLESIRFKVSRKEHKYLSSLSEEEFINAKRKMNEASTYYLSSSDISFLPLEKSIPLKEEELFEELLSLKEKEAKEKHYEKIISFVNKKCISLKKKLSKINMDLKECENANIFKDYGNLLYLGSETYKKGDAEVVIEGIKIPLKKDKDLFENASLYFKKYKKAKSGIEQLNKQIQIATQELSYFEELLMQCNFASPSDYKDILSQLENDKYFASTSKKSNKKKQEVKVFNPHIVTHNNTKIGYGLSSYQNDYLTFTLAHKDDIFLHVKDSHGPHVIIFSDNPDNEVLLLASEIALYFASLEGGEVYYTKKRFVKKIPAKLGLVEINEYKTFLIKSIREETKSMLKKL